MLRRLLRTKDRLEAINRDSFRSGTNFQGEKFILAAENVGTLVQLRERLDRGVLTNKHEFSRGQSCRYSCHEEEEKIKPQRED